MNRNAITFCALRILTVCAAFTAFGSEALGQENVYNPLGPEETASFEKGLEELLPVYTCGIWPRPEKLATAEKPSKYWIAHNEKWLGHILKDDIKPKGELWNSDQWVMVPELRFWANDYILGRFSCASDRIQGDVDFEASDGSITLVFHSPTLFGKTDLDDSGVRQAVVQVLNIPAQFIDELKVERHSAAIGDDKTSICYGKIFWKWDPNKATAWPASKEREWWSFMPFWIAKDKLCINVSTIDWKNNGMPVLGSSTLKDKTKAKPTVK
jgi:hypothetical protein